MATKIKAPRLYIRGVARYPKTDKGYTYSKKDKKSLPDPKGRMSVEVIVSAEDAAKYEATIKAYVVEAGKKPAKLKNFPFSPETDKETDEETGKVVFKAWQYASNKEGEPRKLGHFNAKGKPLPKGFRLSSGSEVIIAVRPNVYDELGGGVNLYLDGVQVIKFREFDGNPGFGEVEGGYLGDEDEDEDTASDTTADDADVDGGSDDEDPTDF